MKHKGLAETVLMRFPTHNFLVMRQLEKLEEGKTIHVLGETGRKPIDYTITKQRDTVLIKGVYAGKVLDIVGKAVNDNNGVSLRNLRFKNWSGIQVDETWSQTVQGYLVRGQVDEKEVEDNIFLKDPTNISGSNLLERGHLSHLPFEFSFFNSLSDPKLGEVFGNFGEKSGYIKIGTETSPEIPPKFIHTGRIYDGCETPWRITSNYYRKLEEECNPHIREEVTIE